MQDELVTLKQRVVALERVLAEVSSQQVRLKRQGWLGLGALLVGLTVGAAIGTPLAAQNPSRVVAPFYVVDKAGHSVFRADVSPGGIPTGYFYDDTGDIAVAIGAKPGTPAIQLLKNGIFKGGMGVAQGGNALLELLGTSEKQRVLVVGSQGLTVTNNLGNDAASIGVDVQNQGYALVKNRAGAEMAALAVAGDSSGGRVTVSKPGAVTVLMGILDSGKGDVCANGAPPRQVCMSGLAVKTLTPY
jgi:hypothetical protein